MTYANKLKDPRWQRLRLEIFQRDEFKCQFCFDERTVLHVHHKYYEANKDPWDYPRQSLITLCEVCHENEETLRSIGNRKLWTEAVLHSPFALLYLRVWGEALRAMKTEYAPGILAYAYANAFSDPEMQKLIVDKFIEKMKSNG